MKLCKDCKYCVPSVYKTWYGKKIVSYSFAKCSHPFSLDYVTGEPRRFCDSNREYYSKEIHHCAPEARYWEPK